MSQARWIGLALTSLISLQTPKTWASWTSATVSQNPGDGVASSMAETSFPCTVDNMPTICHELGIAYRNEDGILFFEKSTDNGVTFTPEIIVWPPYWDNIHLKGEVSLVYSGSTPIINYSADDSEQLYTAKRVPQFQGNCGGPNARWNCSPFFNQAPGAHLSSVIDGDDVLHVGFDASSSLQLVWRPADYSAPFSWSTPGNVTFPLTAVDLAVDDQDEVAIAYASSRCFYLASENDAFIPGELIECAQRGAPINDNQVSMVVDANGNPHVVYLLKQTSGGAILRHAYKNHSGWTTENVKTFTTSAPGFDPKVILAADQQSVEAIAWGTQLYANSTNHFGMQIARRNHAGAWVASGVDGKGGRGGSMIRLHDGRLAIVHFDPGTEKLRLSIEN